MKVGDVMTPQVVTAGEDAPVSEVVQAMAQHNISGVPIVDDHGKLAGIVTDRDLVHHLLPRYSELLEEERYRVDAEYTEHRAADLRRRPAREVMTYPVITISADEPLLKAAALLQLRRVKRLVVTRGDDVVGIISRRDVILGLLLGRSS